MKRTLIFVLSVILIIPCVVFCVSADTFYRFKDTADIDGGLVCETLVPEGRYDVEVTLENGQKAELGAFDIFYQTIGGETGCLLEVEVNGLPAQVGIYPIGENTFLAVQVAGETATYMFRYVDLTLEGSENSILENVENAFAVIFGWIMLLGAALFAGPLKELFPLFIVSVSISIVFVAIYVIKTVVWGK